MCLAIRAQAQDSKWALPYQCSNLEPPKVATLLCRALLYSGLTPQARAIRHSRRPFNLGGGESLIPNGQDHSSRDL